MRGERAAYDGLAGWAWCSLVGVCLPGQFDSVAGTGCLAVAGMYHRDVWWVKLWLSFNVAVGDASKPWETTVAGP